MSLYSQDTLRPRSTLQPAQHPPPPTISDRQRSSSFSENLAQRVLGLATPSNDNTTSAGGGGGLSSHSSSFRRRSSGGGGQTMRASSSSLGLGRKDSQNTTASTAGGSFLRSPILGGTNSTSSNGLSLAGGSLGVPTLKTLDSYNARNVAAALDQGMDQGRMIDDVWQSVCVKVLPLFNGEGIRGFVEDLNDLVLTHVQRTFARAASTTTNRPRYHSTKNPSLDLSSLVTGLLIADLTDLVRIGCSTLSTKLSPPTSMGNPPNSPSPIPTILTDQKLVERLNEIWLFFYTGILPQLEAVFWVLRCDDRLRAAVGGTGMERNEERTRARGEGRIDVRRIALIEFRDGILHPEMDRLTGIFEKLYENQENLGESTTTTTTKEEEQNNSSTSTTAPPEISIRDIRRSRSQPRTSSEFNVVPPPNPKPSPFLSPPLPSSSFVPPPHPVPTTTPTNHLPVTPIRQFSSPARLPSPDPSPSNSPTATRRNTLINSTTSTSTASGTAAAGGGGLEGQSKQSLQRRLQMILVLKSLRTLDDRQEEMDRLARMVVANSSTTRRRKTRARRTRTREENGRRREEDDDEEGSYRAEGTVEDGEDEDDEDEKPSPRPGVVDSPRILFDEPSDLSDAGNTNNDHISLSRRPSETTTTTTGYEIPYSATSSAAPSRSNSRTRPGGRRSMSSQRGGSASGYASPILSTSPTEAALDLSGLGYALSRVREEESTHGREGGPAGEASESSDGVTPTASAPGSIMVETGGGGGVGEVKKNNTRKRRSLFLPSLGRSNSTHSATQQAETSDSLGGGDQSNETGGEKFRRNLLRRNSSRNSTSFHQSQERHEMSMVLGGKGLSLEDE
ncbi:HbrB domain-containing protein [Sporobolomyces salmoneus]|uniref:HbrB domain-containing protein n=1 Tax=Sporobolomyces salmoneus TaxID=183962 RepID=UPI00316E23C4